MPAGQELFTKNKTQSWVFPAFFKIDISSFIHIFSLVKISTQKEKNQKDKKLTFDRKYVYKILETKY